MTQGVSKVDLDGHNLAKSVENGYLLTEKIRPNLRHSPWSSK